MDASPGQRPGAFFSLLKAVRTELRSAITPRRFPDPHDND